MKVDGISDDKKKVLEKINPTDVPDNLTSFYYTNIQIKEDENKKIKFNNDILHQSKLINYFNGDYSKSKIEKDVNRLTTISERFGKIGSKPRLEKHNLAIEIGRFKVANVESVF